MSHCSFVASALVPAAQTTPLALEYIARSTTSCRRRAAEALDRPRRSACRPRPGTRLPTLTFVRLFAGSVNVFSAVVPSSNSSVTRAPIPRTPTCWRSGCRSACPAPRPIRLPPCPSACPSSISPGLLCASCQPLPVRRPPHRAFDDDRHAVGRRDDRRQCSRTRSAGSSSAALSVSRLFAARRRACTVITLPSVSRYCISTRRRLRARIGDQDEHVEERPGRAFGEEPARRRRRHAGALVARRERLARAG